MREICCPDVAAFKLETGREVLKLNGFIVERILETRPPNTPKGKGVLRIIRQKMLGDRTVELVVSYESYVKEVN